MNSPHLSDYDIQDYLDHNLNNPALVDEHLASCSVCREKLAVYSELYVELSAPAPFSLPENFASSAADTAFSGKKSFFNPGFLNVILIIMVTVAVIAVTQRYFDFQTVGKDVVDSMVPQINFNTDAIADNFSFSVDSWEKYKIWFYCAAAIVFTFLMENLLSRGRLLWKKTMMCLILK